VGRGLTVCACTRVEQGYGCIRQQSARDVRRRTTDVASVRSLCIYFRRGEQKSDAEQSQRKVCDRGDLQKVMLQPDGLQTILIFERHTFVLRGSFAAYLSSFEVSDVKHGDGWVGSPLLQEPLPTANAFGRALVKRQQNDQIRNSVERRMAVLRDLR